MTIRERIIKTLGNFPGAQFDAAVVDELERRVEQANPAKPNSFAWIITRNWVVSQDRHRVAVAKKQAALLLTQERERQAEEGVILAQARFEQAKKEFWPAAGQVLAEGTKRQRALQMMTVIWQSVFEGKSDEELVRLYSGSNRDLIFQWRRRGRKALKQYASPTLWAVISQGMWG